MESLIMQKGGGAPPGWTKFYKVLFGLGAIILTVAVGNWAMPHLIKFFKNGVLTVGWAAAFTITCMVTAGLGILIAKNWRHINRLFLGLCEGAGKRMVKNHEISYMRGWLSEARTKFEALGKNKLVVRGQETFLGKKIAESDAKKQEHLNLGAAAMKLYAKKKEEGASLDELSKLERQAAHEATLAKPHETSVNVLTPRLIALKNTRIFLDNIGENWRMGIEAIENEVNTMEDLAETLGVTNKAVELADDYMQGGSAIGDYLMAKKSLEQNLSQMMANIQDFEERAKPVIEQMELKKEVDRIEGIETLNRYIEQNQQTILLPTSGQQLEALKANAAVPTNAGSFDSLI